MAPQLSVRVADHVGSRIVEGELPAGEHVPEQALAEELGVSRGTVREAMLVLEARWLVEILPRRGAVVRAMDRSCMLELLELTAATLSVCVRMCCVRLDYWPDASQPKRLFKMTESGKAEMSPDDYMKTVYYNMATCMSAIGCEFLRENVERLVPPMLRVAKIIFSHPDASLAVDMQRTMNIWDHAAKRESDKAEAVILEQFAAWSRMVDESVDDQGTVRIRTPETVAVDPHAT